MVPALMAAAINSINIKSINKPIMPIITLAMANPLLSDFSPNAENTIPRGNKTIGNINNPNMEAMNPAIANPEPSPMVLFTLLTSAGFALFPLLTTVTGVSSGLLVAVDTCVVSSCFFLI